MKGIQKVEAICHIATVSLIVILYVILGLAMLFGPEEIRLARTWNTIRIALMAGVATGIFYCLLSFTLIRIIFIILNTLKGRRNPTLNNPNEA